MYLFDETIFKENFYAQFVELIVCVPETERQKCCPIKTVQNDKSKIYNKFVTSKKMSIRK